MSSTSTATSALISINPSDQTAMLWLARTIRTNSLERASRHSRDSQ
jgi:hypothetical protein